MPRRSPNGRSPDWNTLYEVAAPQAGYFTTKQAEEAGYSPQLLQFYIREGRVEHWGRGLFRLVQFPPSEHEDLVPIWLWSERQGVFSHETALALFQLTDLLPNRRHLMLPLSWSRRRLRAPVGVVLHIGHLSKDEKTWVGSIPATTPLRSVIDCVQDHMSPEFIEQAIEQGVRRRLFTRGEFRAHMRARKSA